MLRGYRRTPVIATALDTQKNHWGEFFLILTARSRDLIGLDRTQAQVVFKSPLADSNVLPELLTSLDESTGFQTWLHIGSSGEL